MDPHARTTERSAGMIGLVEPDLATPDPAGDLASIEGQRMRGALEQRLFDADPVPVKIGRFVVVDVLGRGGNGVVYRCFDPDLDRTVAVKVLTSATATHRARLAREAKALARLSHPNVVAIYEVGEQAGRVFLAMEHVDGGSLAEICARRGGVGRAWTEEVVGWLEQCARGLAAAHRAGLVHRDLKPGNILIGSDGRARLADFGLARTELRESAASVETAEQLRSASDELDRLTVTGALLGTPAYMAPEQLRGRADVRTDQFGLCATFFEALWGMRAYPGDERATLFASLESGTMIAPPSGDVPEHVRRVLLRGLSARAEDRFASIDALLAALDRGRRRRRRLLALGGIAAFTVAGAFALASVADPIAACATDEAALDLAWGPSRRAAVERAILGSGATDAPMRWSIIAGTLDEIAATWTASDLAACRQAHDPDPEIAAVGRTRLQCGVRAIALFEASTAALTVADQKTLLAVRELTDALADQLACDATTELDTDDSMQLALLLDRAALEVRLNRFEEAERLAREVLDATQPGELPRLRAGAHLSLATVHTNRGDRERELDAVRSALTEAELADDPILLCESWSHLAIDAAEHGSRDTAAFYFARAERLDQAGRLTAPARARLWVAQGRAELEGGRAHEAIPFFEDAVAEHERLGDLDFSYTLLLSMYSQALEFADRAPDAIAVGERALALAQAQLGPEHPMTAVLRATVARMYGFVDQDERAASELLAALQILDKNPWFRPGVRAELYDDLAQNYAILGRIDDARVQNDRALALQRELNHGCNEACVTPLMTRGRILIDLGQPEAGLSALDDARVLFGSDIDPADSQFGELELLRAHALAKLGRADEAQASLDNGTAVLARAYGPESGFAKETAETVEVIRRIIDGDAP